MSKDRIKILMIYVGIFMVPCALVLIMLSNDQSAEDKVLGRWQEVSWEYEKIDKKREVGEENWDINEQQKYEISQGLVFHEAETWHFLPTGELELYNQTGLLSQLEWRIKGHGNILKLEKTDAEVEHYQIQKLDDNKMEIHFNTDLQVRGIVKMTFVKV
ncbi:hypothetical protein LVD15_23490 [Fulvivirga maritima]|uniref:hypothetical protein n=1 Tax=Fulvivirga maritima TaxID=2904247 RepID=UPI001F21ED56|nr:hypothetical protein [Fulvivirga maritima]UII26228.1 hypothetical protein LVD15_23490 [Fulvivirga maritima]